jgi:hypothetical protein
MFAALTSLCCALALHAPGIHGHVRGFDGEPVANLILNIVDADGQYLADTSTRADGSYRFRANGAARRVFVWLEGVELERAATGGDEVDFAFQSASYFTLQVRAVDPAGQPLAGVELHARGAKDVCMATPKTDRDGRFRLRCNHRVENFVVDPGGWRHVVKGPYEKDGDVTIDLRDCGFFQLSGRVTDENGKSVSDAVVALSDFEFGRVTHTRSDAAGRYALWANRRVMVFHVTAGEYVRCMLRGAWERTETVDLDWRALGLVVLTGRVLDAGGKPVPNVPLIPSDTEELAGHAPAPIGRTSQDGTFRVLLHNTTAFVVGDAGEVEFVAAGPWTRDAVIELRPKR